MTTILRYVCVCVCVFVLSHFFYVGQAAVSSDAILPEAPREVLPLITSSNLKAEKKKEFKLIEGNQYLRSTVSDLSLAVDDLIIPWNELILKEKIGAGTCK